MTDPEERLPPADEVIRRQQQEIEELTRRLEDEGLAQRLREALRAAASAGVLASPVTHSGLLELIVETAARTISADGAALLLLDEEAEELVFEVALGAKADEATRFRVPLGEGVAGLVALTGQPLAISNAEIDPRHAVEIARGIGYQPQTLLCVPLVYDERVIGVLELLDKRGGQSFTAADIDALTLFARQAAVAIQQSLVHMNLPALVYSVLDAIAGGTDGALREAAKEFAVRAESEDGHRRAIELAELVAEIAGRGEAETEACRRLLQSFADYLRMRPETVDELTRIGE